jgi:hypothetical protein
MLALFVFENPKNGKGDKNSCPLKGDSFMKRDHRKYSADNLITL